jgi:hypothetical protein
MNTAMVVVLSVSLVSVIGVVTYRKWRRHERLAAYSRHLMHKRQPDRLDDGLENS